MRRCGFVAFDDDFTVYENPHLRDGISAHGLRWAFTADLLHDSPNAAYWVPLTVVSHMAATEAFGLDPGGHHLVNLLLHALNAVLLFLVLERATAAALPSALAAAVFAVHPLQVEAVAWVTARKDVLSGLFALLTVAAYVGWTRGGGRRSYGAMLASFALSLLAKPLVMLPLMLLLLDVWPLRRWEKSNGKRLVLEKAPLFALAALSAGLALLAVGRGGHMAALDVTPVQARVANALQSLAAYVADVVWPAGLAAFYPMRPASLLSPPTVAAAAMVGVLTAGALALRRAAPYAFTGWLWFVIGLAPLLGLLQAGRQARADRFAYLPLAGLTVAMAWGAADLVRRRAALRAAAGAAAVVALAACAVASRRQVTYWRDTTTLFERAHRVAGGSAMSHSALAWEAARGGRLEEAEARYREAMRLEPTYLPARLNLAALLEHRSRPQQALAELQEAERVAPASPEVQVDRAMLELRRGNAQEAERRLRSAVRLDPRSAHAHFSLGNFLTRQGRPAEAAPHYAEAVRLRPDHADARNNLGRALALQGRFAEAAAQLSRALALAPRHPQARTNLGRALAGQGLLAAAEAQLLLAVQANPGDADAHYELGRLFEAQGRRAEASARYQEATRLEPGFDAARAAAARLEAPR